MHKIKGAPQLLATSCQPLAQQKTKSNRNKQNRNSNGLAHRALRSKSRSCAPACGGKEKSALCNVYDPSELGSDTTKLVP